MRNIDGWRIFADDRKAPRSLPCIQVAIRVLVQVVLLCRVPITFMMLDTGNTRDPMEGNVVA
jgi:hypothetical protein